MVNYEPLYLLSYVKNVNDAASNIVTISLVDSNGNVINSTSVSSSNA